ncbi:amidohydrolase family protein [Streptomyces sp. NPDC002564]|uniref:amidohydrolase family protein n=1 Tax=Streptomyces sp. NPDC002564 TaxID=3364649 RepID=UPI00368EE95D
MTNRPTPPTAVVNARVFDGEQTLEATTVIFDATGILTVGGEAPSGARRLDAAGATLLPGLIDAHVHTNAESLALALRFGVTTELEMQGTNTADNRAHITDDDTVADVRSSGFGITPPGGHPSELFPEGFRPGPPPGAPGPSGPAPLMPFSTTPEQAVAFIPQLVERGSDYIKFMVDDGSVEGHPGLPMLDRATLNAGVAEAKRHGKLTVAHALTIEATEMAIEAGIDGLAHLFMDGPHTDEIITLIRDSGAFVVPCVVLNASMMGITGDDLADDPRVAARLDESWMKTLRSSFNHYPRGRITDVLESVRALHHPTITISDTLNTRAVWRRGAQLTAA